MPLQFVKRQIANNQIDASKMDLAAGQTFDFSSVVTLVAEPVAGTQAATKAYVDNVASGLYWKEPVEVASISNLPATYANGASGVGATLTSTANGAISVDGVSLSANDRLLVRAQTADLQNGIYSVTTVGDAGAPFVITRTTDLDLNDEFPGSAVFVIRGTTYDDAGFVCSTDAPPTIGTDAINFVQFTGLGSVVAGDGLVKVGNTISVDLATNSGLDFNSGKLQVEDAGLVLEKQGWVNSYDEFNTSAQLTFTLISADTSSMPSAFINGGNIKVFRNGQLQRAESGTGQPSDDNGYRIQTSGDDINVVIKDGNALTTNELLQVHYIYNA